MTARKAINMECKRCCGDVGNWRDVCNTPDCAIHFAREGGGSSVKKIKEFCLKCNPLQSHQGLKDCDGRYFDGSVCVLHPFRAGKNPFRPQKAPATEKQLAVRQAFATRQQARASGAF